MSIFNNVRFKSPKRYSYNLSHEVKASMKIGNLYPILRMDVIPGDKFNVNSQHVVKLQPMLAPIMHQVDVKIDYFYIPNRLLTKGFNEFVLGIDPQANPPYITTNHCLEFAKEQYDQFGYYHHFQKMLEGTLWDFLGYPTPVKTPHPVDWEDANEVSSWYIKVKKEIGNDVKLSGLPFLAFRSVWSNYYRWSEQPEDSLWEQYILEDKDISEVVMRYFSVHERAKWERDYFTSALSSPQAGDPQTISIGGLADLVQSDADDISKSSKIQGINPSLESAEWQELGSTTLNVAGGGYSGSQSWSSGSNPVPISGSSLSRIDVTPHTKADLSNATPIDVEILREAFIMQRIKERMSAGGNKPIDRLKSLWGVNSSDARLQVPEYLGGGRSPLVISSVLQQVQDTTNGYALGKQGGEGLSVGRASAFNRYFEEHGIVLGIMRIVPRTAYYQGVHRDLLRVAQGDFALPQLSVLGEQAIKNCELYFGADDPNGTFGYQSRYADYKYIPDKVHGEFKTSLSYWTMARKFESEPRLNAEFQNIDPESVQSSVFSNPSEDTLYVDIYHRITAKRKLKPNVY